jgi:hypothetical protein
MFFVLSIPLTGGNLEEAFNMPTIFKVMLALHLAAKGRWDRHLYTDSINRRHLSENIVDRVL